MPKIVKTVKSASQTRDFNEMFINMVKATSYALGIDYKTDSDGSTLYIPMDSFGYTGWCVTFELTSTGNATIGIRTTSNGLPNHDDSCFISVEIGAGLQTSSVLDYNPMTCAVFRDDSNDTISFSAVPGNDETAAGYGTYADFCRYTFKIFFAKDVNDEILCGVGDTHIISIRSSDSTASIPSGSSHLYEVTQVGLPYCLHLTKMVNYLSSGYPEMKTAYVAVVRPESSNERAATVTGVDVNSSYYADGARWGYAGVYNNMGASISTVAPLFKPFEPWVKY